MYERTKIRKLIGTYSKLIANHKYPLDLTTNEQDNLEGYDEALKRVIGDLNELLNNDVEDVELSLEEKLAYTE